MSDTKKPKLDDEIEYHGYRAGRPTRTVEVHAPDGTITIEEGVLTFDLVTREEMWRAREDGGWIDHFVSPEGGIGFGIGEDNPGGVALRYDLEGFIEFDEPMTEKEADGFLVENREKWEHFVDETIESDMTAADLLEEIR